MIDWFRVLSDLQRCGKSVRAVAREKRIHYQRLYRVKNGGASDLSHDDGERVLSYWCDLTHRPRDEAPRLRR